MMGGDSVSWGVAELCGQRGKQRWIMPILFKVTSDLKSVHFDIDELTFG